MKKFKYIAMAFAALLFASCMGDSYADPDDTETIKVPVSPYGNNKLTEDNVITIAQLKSDYAKNIASNTAFTKIDKDIKIKGYVTGNDIGGNLYQEVSVQDETGALLVCINAGGLHGYLTPGQQILIDLKNLYIGGYGKQPEIGGIYTNLKTGATSIGKMDRPTWQQHYKLIGESDAKNIEPAEFDLSKVSDAAYMEENAGKLMVLKKVSFKDADGKTVFAPNDATTNCYLVDATTGKNISTSSLVVRTSGYAKFANQVLPEGAYNITGIFTRYNNTWQILIRDISDLEQTTISVFSEKFSESQGDFKIENITPANGVTAVWNWANANYGMKASGYNSKSYANCSRLTSPEIDLSKVQEATLTLDQAINKTSDDPKKECKIQVSTDGTNWKDVEADVYPAGNSWDFVTSTINLKKYCGKKIYISFLYTSTDNSAPTWEIKNILVK